MASLLPKREGAKKGLTVKLSAPKSAQDPVARATTSNRNALSRILAAGESDPTKKKGPSALERIFGIMDVPGTLVRTAIHDSTNTPDDKDLGFGEVGKAWRGEKRVAGSDILGDWGVDNKWGRMLGGFLFDVVTDPATYLSFGTSSLAKEGGISAVGKLAAKGELTLDALKGLGVTDDVLRAVAPYADDAGKIAVEALGGSKEGVEASRALMQGVYRALGDEGGVKLAGISLGGQDTLAKAGYGLKDILRKIPGSEWAERAFGAGELTDEVRKGNEVYNAGLRFIKRKVSGAKAQNAAETQRFVQSLLREMPDEAERVKVTFAIGQGLDDAAPAINEANTLLSRAITGRRRAMKDMLERSGIDVASYEGDDVFERMVDDSLKAWDEAQAAADTAAAELKGAKSEARGLSNWLKQSQGSTKKVGTLVDGSFDEMGSVTARSDSAGVLEMPNEAPRSTLSPEAASARDALADRANALWNGSPESLGVSDLATAYGFELKEGSLNNLQSFISWLSKQAEVGKAKPEDVGLLRQYMGAVRDLGKYREGYAQTGMGISAQAPRRMKEVAAEIEKFTRQFGRDEKNARGLESAIERYFNYDGALQSARDDFQRISAQAADPQRIRDALASMDIPEARIAQLMQNVILPYRERMVARLKDQLAEGIDVKDLGPNYMKGMAPVERTRRDEAARVSALQSVGINTGDLVEREKSGVPFLSKQIPSDSAAKKYLTPKGSLEGILRSGAKTLPDGTAVKALDTEADIARIAAASLTEQGDNIAFAQFQKEAKNLVGDDAKALELLSKVEPVFTNDEATRGFLKAYDKVLNAWKLMATSLNLPAFPARNSLSNKFLQWTEGVLDPTTEGKAAQVVMDAMKGTVQAGDEDLVNRLVSNRVFTSAEEIAEIVGGRRPPKWIEQVGSVNEFVENQSRVAAFLAADKKLSAKVTGEARDAAAAALVDKALYSYDPAALTAFERNFMRRIMPFYVWMRRNTPHMVELVAKNPGKVAVVGHLKENADATNPVNESVMPEWMRDTFPIATPLKFGGQQMMVSTAGVLPVGDLEKLNLIRDGKVDPRDLLGSMSPLIKTPLELAFNRDIYYGDEIARYPGEKRRAPGYVERFDDLMDAVKIPGISDAWGMLKDAFGIEERQDAITGEPYLAMDAKAVKAMKDASPWMNNVGKLVADAPRTPYDRASYATGVRVMPFDEERFARQQVFDDQAELQSVMARLRDEGRLPDAQKRPKKTSSLIPKRR